MLEEDKKSINRMYKAKGGLITTNFQLENDTIKNVKIFGDFFFYPEDKLFELEKELINMKKDEILDTITNFYLKNEIESPGLEPKDFFIALFGNRK